MSDAAAPFEYLKVPDMAMPTVPPEQWQRVKYGWDYVRHGMLGLAAQRIQRDGVEGDMAEAGVWRGDCAAFLHMFAPDRRLYLFDTFKGFPGDEDQRFRETSVDIVRQTVGPSSNIIIKEGVFPDATAGLGTNKFALVSLDLDTFEGILAGWEFFYPRLSPAGYLFVHDYNAMEYDRGPFRATTEFLKGKPETIIEMVDQWGSAVLRKNSAPARTGRLSRWLRRA